MATSTVSRLETQSSSSELERFATAVVGRLEDDDQFHIRRFLSDVEHYRQVALAQLETTEQREVVRKAAVTISRHYLIKRAPYPLPLPDTARLGLLSEIFVGASVDPSLFDVAAATLEHYIDNDRETGFGQMQPHGLPFQNGIGVLQETYVQKHRNEVLSAKQSSNSFVPFTSPSSPLQHKPVSPMQGSGADAGNGQGELGVEVTDSECIVLADVAGTRADGVAGCDFQSESDSDLDDGDNVYFSPLGGPMPSNPPPMGTFGKASSTRQTTRVLDVEKAATIIGRWYVHCRRRAHFREQVRRALRRAQSTASMGSSARWQQVRRRRPAFVLPDGGVGPSDAASAPTLIAASTQPPLPSGRRRWSTPEPGPLTEDVAGRLFEVQSALRGALDYVQGVAVGCSRFNRDPQKGMKYMTSKGLVENNPQAIAQFLLSQSRLSKTMIGEYLGGHHETNLAVLRHVANSMDLTGQTIVQAIRTFLSYFRLPGEAQKIDRIMEQFARKYCSDNPQMFRHTDTAYVLSFSIIMLNTDQHNPNVPRPMTRDQFVRNNRGIDGGSDLPISLLEGIYEDVSHRPIITKDPHLATLDQLATCIAKCPPLPAPHRWFVKQIQMTEVVDASRKALFGKHSREVFLFSDMLMVTKIMRTGIKCKFRSLWELYRVRLKHPTRLEAGVHAHSFIIQDMGTGQAIHLKCPSGSVMRSFLEQLLDRIIECRMVDKEKLGDSNAYHTLYSEWASTENLAQQIKPQAGGWGGGVGHSIRKTLSLCQPPAVPDDAFAEQIAATVLRTANNEKQYAALDSKQSIDCLDIGPSRQSVDGGIEVDEVQQTLAMFGDMLDVVDGVESFVAQEESLKELEEVLAHAQIAISNVLSAQPLDPATTCSYVALNDQIVDELKRYHRVRTVLVDGGLGTR